MPGAERLHLSWKVLCTSLSDHNASKDITTETKNIGQVKWIILAVQNTCCALTYLLLYLERIKIMHDWLIQLIPCNSAAYCYGILGCRQELSGYYRSRCMGKRIHPMLKSSIRCSVPYSALSGCCRSTFLASPSAASGEYLPESSFLWAQ